MPSLKDTVIADLQVYLDNYFCLSLSEKNTAKELQECISLLQGKKIEFLDITFSQSLQKNPSYLKEALTALIPGLKGTKISRLDLSCNSLYQLEFSDFKHLLTLIPENITTIALSGNDWGKLGLKAGAFLKELQEVTGKELLFEGTDQFERLLTPLQQKSKEPLVQASSTDRNRLFSKKEEIQTPTDQSGSRLDNII